MSGGQRRPGRREYRQASARYCEAGYIVEPSEKRGSAMLTPAVGANLLLVIPEESAVLHAGERSTVLLLAYEGTAR